MIQSFKQLKNAAFILLALLFCVAARAQDTKNRMTTTPKSNLAEQYQTYLGTWYDTENAPNVLTISEIIGDTIKFELSVYRIAEIYAKAKITTNEIKFNGNATDTDGPIVNGRLVFKKNSISVIIDQSEFEYIKPTYSYDFNIKGKKSGILKHRFRSDDFIAMFFDDGIALLTDEVHSDVGQENRKTYVEYPNRLHLSNDAEIKFFDNNGLGHINPGWEVIRYYRIASNRQITNLISDIDHLGQFDDVKYIEETCLIILPLRGQPLSDDRMFYEYQTVSKFEKMGIKIIHLGDGAEKGEDEAGTLYLNFKLYDGTTFFVDTNEEQNASSYSALLYRKGYIPIIIDIVGSDEQDEEIEGYLFSESGDGAPIFESWRTDS